MKKFYSLILATLISMATFSQVKLTSSIEENFNGITWENSFQTEYEYDLNNNLYKEIYFLWEPSGSLWEQFAQSIFSYNVDSKEVENIFQFWDPLTNQYDNFYKNTYIYNSNGDIIEFMEYSWDDLDWIANSKTEITYDNNKLDYSISYTWDIFGYQWVNDEKTTFFYNANNLIESTIDQDWNGFEWIDYSKDIYTYNASGKITEYVYQEWVDPEWLNLDKITYEFDANGNMNKETDYTYDSGWAPNSKTENTFDLTKLMSDYIHPFKDKIGVDYLFGNNSYYNKITNSNGFTYNNIGNAWEDSSITTFYYDGATVGVSDFELNKISIYPNPTSDFVFINGHANITTFKIFDFAGKTIVQEKLNSSTKIDISNLKEGLYILEMKTAEGQTKRSKVYKK